MMPKEKNQYILDKIIEFIENRNDELWKRNDGQVWTFDNWEQVFKEVKQLPEVWEE